MLERPTRLLCAAAASWVVVGALGAPAYADGQPVSRLNAETQPRDQVLSSVGIVAFTGVTVVAYSRSRRRRREAEQAMTERARRWEAEAPASRPEPAAPVAHLVARPVSPPRPTAVPPLPKAPQPLTRVVSPHRAPDRLPSATRLRLEDLARRHRQGLISDEEYAGRRQALLDDF